MGTYQIKQWKLVKMYLEFLTWEKIVTFSVKNTKINIIR